MELNRKDVIWGYFAQFFSIASGIVTLPLILSLLSAEEVGLNYLLITIGSMIALLDFGFSPQFARNFSYVFTGAQDLKKEGINIEDASKPINYKLLKNLIHTARFVYRRLSVISTLFLLVFGSIYVYYITQGFTSIPNIFIIWIVFVVSVFFNIYYSYYNALLLGKGLITESKKVMVFSRLVQIIFVFLLLLLDFGLLGVVVANTIAPFVGRFLSNKWFFTKELMDKLNRFDISKTENVELFNVIWYNARKLGVVFIGGFAINRFSMFLAGIYLSLSTIASYGLLLQLGSLLTTMASTLFVLYQPKFASLRVKGNRELLTNDFAFSMTIYYLLFFIGVVFILIFGVWGLSFIQSNTQLPDFSVMVIYFIVLFLEGNHSNFATFIVTNNQVPFVNASLISGGLIVIGSYLALEYSNLSLLGLILVQGIVQLAYSNWKWPSIVLREANLNFFSFLRQCVLESTNRYKKIFYGIEK